MEDGVQSGQGNPSGTPDIGSGSGVARELVQATKIAEQTPLEQAPNGVRYAAYGENNLPPAELERMVQAVPTAIAAALSTKGYYFVPLAMASSQCGDRDHRSSSEATMVSPVYTPELGDQAICHRNVGLAPSDGRPKEGIFISTRLLNDRFALAFEFFINVGHAFVEVAGVPESFNQLVWEQALKDVRGETSQDAWESRAQAIGQFPPQPSSSRTRPGGKPSAIRTGISSSDLPIDEKARTEYLEAAFADAVAIYQLSLSVDFNYSELREREYPLLAPQPLAERLRLAARLFPPNPGYEFAVRYRRRA